MALAAVQSAMHLEKKIVHPFFSKPTRPPSPQRTLSPQDASVDPSQGDADRPLDTQPPKTRKKRTRKSDGAKEKKDNGLEQKIQAPLNRFTRPLNIPHTGESALALDEDSGHDRKKRQKTASPALVETHHIELGTETRASNLDWLLQLQTEVEMDAARLAKVSADSKMDIIPVSEASISLLPKNSIETGPFLMTNQSTIYPETLKVLVEPRKTTPKKKTMKVSKSGKLVSPIPTNSEPAVASSPRKRRKRTVSKVKSSSMIITIRYGSDVKSRRAIGQKIEDILIARKQLVSISATMSRVLEKPTSPPKSTHPFFLGKPAPKADEASSAKSLVEHQSPPFASSQRKSAVTPGKIRAESRMHQPLQSMPTFGPIGGSSRAKNQHGLCEPLWPSKDNAHVRNLEITPLNFSGRLQESTTINNEPLYTAEGAKCLNSQSHILRPPRLKSNVIRIPHNDNLITRLSQQLKLTVENHDKELGTHFEPAEDIHLPKRLLTTGFDIQERVRSEVQALLPRLGEHNPVPTGTHPAVDALFKDVEHTLTPFDRGTCESQTWVQKYTPTCAAHVLQSGNEATVLRDWLQNLTVKSVLSNCTATANIQERRKHLKKKRKKEEDDFIVFSDEEEGGDLVEISDSEVYGQSEGLPRQKSVKRPQVSRHENVIVISGPHGCGKSAAVYAAAEELGFEVFEINSSSRRSGRDVQDKVGDMSENHLVSSKRIDIPAKADLLLADDTDIDMGETLQKELDSGRQGTVTSFYTSKLPIKLKPKAKVTAKESQKAPTGAQATLPIAQAPRKPQKQSLILFEEADVLFEEDQQFWLQVHRLASQSKRPVVITCNNEALIQTDGLPLAAILRFSPPPVDLAADYLLVLAAREGHILERKAVCDLLHARDHDLRASITELDFWCQMSVGDRKGGLEWIYQRWPPGKDVDDNGRLLRVASQGTYFTGLGWLSHDVSVSAANIGFDKGEELLKGVWSGWGVSPRYVNPTQADMENADLQNLSDERGKALQTLERLDALSESTSAADVYCRVGLPSYEDYHQEPVDPSLPPISVKELSNYTQMTPVIQIDHVSDFTSFDTDMFITSHMSIQRAYGSPRGPETHVTLNTNRLSETILKHKHEHLNQVALSWPDFSVAFDILALPPATTLEVSKSYHLTASSFDRTFKIVTEDLAPYVRSIVAYERLREAERIRLSNLLSEGGTRKRPRTTRASRVAMEGGQRETKRKERWFDKNLNMTMAMATAGESWAGLGSLIEESELESRTRGSSVSTQQGYR